MGGLCKRPSPASTTSPRVASRVLLWNAGPRGWGVLPCVLVAVAVGLCHMAVCKEPERGSWVTRTSDAPSTWRWRPMSRAQWLPHLKRLHSEGFRWDPCRTIVGFGSTLVFSFCGSFGVSILRRKPGSESSSNPGWCDPRWVGVPGPGTQYHTTRTCLGWPRPDCPPGSSGEAGLPLGLIIPLLQIPAMPTQCLPGIAGPSNLARPPVWPPWPLDPLQGLKAMAF